MMRRSSKANRRISTLRSSPCLGSSPLRSRQNAQATAVGRLLRRTGRITNIELRRQIQEGLTSSFEIPCSIFDIRVWCFWLRPKACFRLLPRCARLDGRHQVLRGFRRFREPGLGFHGDRLLLAARSARGTPEAAVEVHDRHVLIPHFQCP